MILPPMAAHPSVPSSMVVTPKKTIDAQWQDYFDNLRTCTPATHTLTQIDPIAISAYGHVVIERIIGKQADRCHVTTILKQMTPGVSGQAMPRITAPNALDCHYTQATILLVVNHFSNMLQRMKNPAASPAMLPPKGDPYTKAIENDCNVIVVL